MELIEANKNDHQK